MIVYTHTRSIFALTHLSAHQHQFTGSSDTLHTHIHSHVHVHEQRTTNIYMCIDAIGTEVYLQGSCDYIRPSSRLSPFPFPSLLTLFLPFLFFFTQIQFDGALYLTISCVRFDSISIIDSFLCGPNH